MSKTLYIWCDGATAGTNPGPAAVGVCLQDEGGTALREVSERVGDGRPMTNNEAEYRAVLKALWHARDLVAEDITLHSDSQLVVEQSVGNWACNVPELRALRDKVRKCLSAFPSARLVWVPREQNTRADALASAALGRTHDDRDLSAAAPVPTLTDAQRERGIAEIERGIAEIERGIAEIETQLQGLRAEVRALRVQSPRTAASERERVAA